MPEQDDAALKGIDIAVLRCLRQTDAPIMPTDLLPCLREQFPESDEVDMREGRALTRLRARTLVHIDDTGRVSLTDEGRAAVDGL